MKKDLVEENWKPLVALVLGLGVGALIAKSIIDSDNDDDDDHHGFSKKDFACVKLPASALEKYHADGCDVLKLVFDVTGSGKVKLKLHGRRWYDLKPRVKIPLSAEREDCYSSDYPLKGKFKHDDSDISLHDILVKGRTQFTDWWLKPIECPLDPKLVSYILDDREGVLVTYRLNPSPPY